MQNKTKKKLSLSYKTTYKNKLLPSLAPYPSSIFYYLALYYIYQANLGLFSSVFWPLE